MTRAKFRKGSTVYADCELTSELLFPGFPGAFHVHIPQGTKGKVLDTTEDGIPLIQFEKLSKSKEAGTWYIPDNYLSRRKPR